MTTCLSRVRSRTVLRDEQLTETDTFLRLQVFGFLFTEKDEGVVPRRKVELREVTGPLLLTTKGWHNAIFKASTNNTKMNLKMEKKTAMRHRSHSSD